MQIVTGDVGKMHQAPEYAGALFRVASRFNALEMISPDPAQLFSEQKEGPDQQARSKRP